MADGKFRRWCSPGVVLVVMRPGEDPASVLLAVKHAEVSGAKAVLVQLTADTPKPAAMELPLRRGLRLVCPDQIPDTSSGRALMWAEIARRAFILKGIHLDEIPSIVKAFSIDRVVVAADRALGHLHNPAIEQRLTTTLSAPLWILGRGMPLNLCEPARPRRILFPTSLGPDVEFDLTFACDLAKCNDASLSVLHVFGNSTDGSSIRERSPFAVKSRLPLDSLEAAQMAWPMEITIRQGNPATQILQFNEKKPHDLVILRASSDVRERSFSESSLLGGVCSEIRCPVVVLGRGVGHARQATTALAFPAPQDRGSRTLISMTAMER